MFKSLSFYLFLYKTSIRASTHKREAFLLETGLMAASNLIMFLMWWLFFQYFDSIAGWKIEDMAALNAIGLGAYGLMQIFAGGVKKLSNAIINGDLDTFMVQPKNLLLHLLGSHSRAKGWGQLVTALIMIPFIGFERPTDLVLVMVGILNGCIVFTSMNIIAQCLPFWFGSVETLSKKYGDALFLFALYPTNIYRGVLQLIMFTAIPAGVIGYLPVELVRNFSWTKFIFLFSAAACFASLAAIIFYRGLRRYESGNQFGVRL